jgi:hypothetical protein
MDQYLTIPMYKYLHYSLGQYIHRENYFLNHQNLRLSPIFTDKSQMVPVDENEQCVRL